MPGIFINYRREDTAAYAGRIYDRLSAHFGTQSVFMDVDAITPGMDFETLIESKLQSSAVMIVLIGKAWLTALDSSGSVRLHNQADLVRREIAAALSRNILVIPVLVGGAIMPPPQDLPDLITPLVRRQAFQISDSRFHKDIGDLISILEGVKNTVKERRPAASMIHAFIAKIKHKELYSGRTAVVAIAVLIVVAVLLVQGWYQKMGSRQQQSTETSQEAKSSAGNAMEEQKAEAVPKSSSSSDTTLQTDSKTHDTNKSRISSSDKQLGRRREAMEKKPETPEAASNPKELSTTASNISGDWIAEVPKIQEDGKTYEIRFTFFTAGDDLRGTVSRDKRFRANYFGYGRIKDGKIEGDNIYFEVKNMYDVGGYRGGPVDGRYQEELKEFITVFQGKVAGNVIHFDVPENGSGPVAQFTAKRVNP